MAYLDPWDLLHLGRVSRDFRKIIFTPKAASLWKQSIKSVGLPPSPDGMTEPAYIALLFDTEYCVCYFSLFYEQSLKRKDFLPSHLGMWKFARSTPHPTTQNEALCKVQVKAVSAPAYQPAAVDHGQYLASNGSLLARSQSL